MNESEKISTQTVQAPPSTLSSQHQGFYVGLATASFAILSMMFMDQYAFNEDERQFYYKLNDCRMQIECYQDSVPAIAIYTLGGKKELFLKQDSCYVSLDKIIEEKVQLKKQEINILEDQMDAARTIK